MKEFDECRPAMEAINIGDFEAAHAGLGFKES